MSVAREWRSTVPSPRRLWRSVREVMHVLRVLARFGGRALSFLLPLAFASAAYGAWPLDPQTNLPVSSAPGDQQFPVLVQDGEGGAIICWHDGRLGYPNLG